MKTKVHYFNLIEVLIALGLAAIGLVGIMALFPVGLVANKESKAQFNGSNTAEQLLHRIVYRANQANPNYPATEPDKLLWNKIIKTPAPVSSTVAAISTVEPPATNVAWADDGNWEATAVLYTNDTIFASNTTPGKYKIVNRTPFDVDGNGSIAVGEFVEDFYAIAYVWRSPIRVKKTDVVIDPVTPGDLTSDSNYNFAAGLNVRISWDASIPDVTKRDEAYYYTEVFKKVVTP